MARLGFLLFGLGVLWLAASPVRGWGAWASLVHGCFGVMMLGTAAFSHRPWLPDVPFDPIEDLLHSATATGMGFAFAVGVVLVGLSGSGVRCSVAGHSLHGCAAARDVLGGVRMVREGSLPRRTLTSGRHGRGSPARRATRLQRGSLVGSRVAQHNRNPLECALACLIRPASS